MNKLNQIKDAILVAGYDAFLGVNSSYHDCIRGYIDNIEFFLTQNGNEFILTTVDGTVRRKCNTVDDCSKWIVRDVQSVAMEQNDKFNESMESEEDDYEEEEGTYLGDDVDYDEIDEEHYNSRHWY